METALHFLLERKKPVRCLSVLSLQTKPIWTGKLELEFRRKKKTKKKINKNNMNKK